MTAQRETAGLVGAAAEAEERFGADELERHAAEIARKNDRIYRVQSGLGRWTSINPREEDFVNVLGYGAKNYGLRVRVNHTDFYGNYHASVTRAQSGYKQVQVDSYHATFGEAARWCESRGLAEADSAADSACARHR